MSMVGVVKAISYYNKMPGAELETSNRNLEMQTENRNLAVKIDGEVVNDSILIFTL